MADAGLGVRRVYLTGCTGEIGSRVTLILLNLGFEVHGVRGSRNCNINHPLHKCRRLDLLDAAVENGLKEISPEILVHTAWFTKPNEFWESSQNSVWFKASQRLINEFVNLGGRYVVVTGSCAEYSWNTNQALDENAPEDPSSAYGQSKLELLKWLRLQDTPYLWTRTFFQFGMNEPEGRLVPSLIDSLYMEREFVINKGNDIRDFIFVADVARILALLISQNQKGLVNIGSGHGVEVSRISKLIAEMFDRPDLVKIGSGETERSYVVSEPSKLNAIIGKFDWSPLDIALISSIKARKPSGFKPIEKLSEK